METQLILDTQMEGDDNDGDQNILASKSVSDIGDDDQEDPDQEIIPVKESSEIPPESPAYISNDNEGDQASPIGAMESENSYNVQNTEEKGEDTKKEEIGESR